MPLFGRRKDRGSPGGPQDEVEGTPAQDAADAAGDEVVEAEDGQVDRTTGPASAGVGGAASPRPRGPWDAGDLPADDERDRIDLGALRVSVAEDVELRVDLDPQGGVVAATLVHGEELMQVGVFAAPRTEPIWAEVREEIVDSLGADGNGGAVTEVTGDWGVELQARIPTDQPGVFAAARFIGIDGPRWFLRALVTGPMTAAGASDPVLIETLRGLVVVRGGDAMPPREPLPLRLPKEAQVSAEQAMAEQAAAAEAAAEQQEAERRTLPPLAERGPENTETA